MHFIQNHTKITIKDKTTGEDIVVLDTENYIKGNCVAGMPFVDVIDDSLDSFTFVLKDYQRRKPFKPFSFVSYTVNDGISVDTTTLFVLFDNVQSYSRAKKTYQHTITCVESAKILEKTKIFNLNLTNATDTLETQFDKACSNAEPVYRVESQSVEKRYAINYELRQFLKDKRSHDFYFSNTDFRSVLDTMLAPYNARATISSVRYFGKDIISLFIGYVQMDIVKDLSPVWTEEQQGEIIAETLENDGQNYAGKIVARGYNTISQNPITFSDAIKSANATITNENACVFLPFPVSEKGIQTLSFCIKAKYSKVVPGTQGSEEFLTATISVDIAKNIITQEEYDLLDSESCKLFIPYNIGSSTINLGKSHSNWLGFSEVNLFKIVENSIPATCPIEGKEDYNSTGIVNISLDSPFTCTYYPMIDTVADIVKPGVYDKDDILMGIMDSQTEQTLDPERHGKKLHGLIKRTGNTEYVLDVKAKHFSKLLPIMARIDLPNAEDEEEKGYVLYKREYAVYDNFINCRYYFSKDCNAIQASAGVNREKHIYDIPLESDETPLVVKKYLLFSFDAFNESDKSFGNAFALSAISTLVNDSANNKKLKYLLFQSLGYRAQTSYPQDTENSKGEIPYKEKQTYRFMLPLASYALGKCMNFAARTLDNYSVGYARDGYTFSIWGDGGNKITFNRYVDKTKNRVGECTSFKITYAFDFNGNASNDNNPPAPIADKDAFELANTNEILYSYNKDRTQRPLFVLAVESIPVKKDYGNIIIGSNFAKNNNLLKNNAITALSLYVSFRHTFVGDEEFLSASYCEGEQSNQTYSISSIGALFDVETTNVGAVLKYNNGNPYNAGVLSWAIVDGYKNIYFACNGPLRSVYASLADFPI